MLKAGLRGLRVAGVAGRTSSLLCHCWWSHCTDALSLSGCWSIGWPRSAAVLASISSCRHSMLVQGRLVLAPPLLVSLPGSCISATVSSSTHVSSRCMVCMHGGWVSCMASQPSGQGWPMCIHAHRTSSSSWPAPPSCLSQLSPISRTLAARVLFHASTSPSVASWVAGRRHSGTGTTSTASGDAEAGAAAGEGDDLHAVDPPRTPREWARRVLPTRSSLNDAMLCIRWTSSVQ
jgi:hypothetical protein